MKNNSIWLKIWVEGKKTTILKKRVSWRKEQEHNSRKKIKKEMIDEKELKNRRKIFQDN